VWTLTENTRQHGSVVLLSSIDSFLNLLQHNPYSTNKVKTLQKANKTFFNGQNQSLVTFISKDALKSSNYAICQTFSLISSDPNVPIQLLDNWSQEGNPDEKAWYITRYLLFKIVSDRVAEAKLIFAHYSSSTASPFVEANKPLMEFLRLLFRCIDTKHKTAFETLSAKFTPFLGRDPELNMLVERIGTSHFGIVKPRQPNMFEMMGRMMGM
jgi:Golgi to ER traffic protein 4